MKTVEFDAMNGVPIPDGQAIEAAKLFLNLSIQDHIKVSSEIFVHAIRMLVHEGYFPHDQVRFQFKAQFIMPDKHGRMETWPAGFCQTYDDVLTRLLTNFEHKDK